MRRIVIVDDVPMVRKGFRQLIAETNDLVLAGEAGAPGELFGLLRSEPFDLVVLEIALASGRGIELLSQIKSEFPALPVLVLSRHDERLFAARALRAGASGYCAKQDAPEKLIEAIRRVLAGRTYLSERLAESVAADLARTGRTLLPHERLSHREFEVFRMLGGGQSASSIARTLNLSVKTVSTHRTRILDKTGFADNAEIVRYVTSHQLV